MGFVPPPHPDMGQEALEEWARKNQAARMLSVRFMLSGVVLLFVIFVIYLWNRSV